MKKFAILFLAVTLAACSSPPAAAPTEPPAPTVVQPSPTPVVIIQTVVVEATQPATEVPPPTQVPPTATPVVVTVVVEATQPVATPQVVAPTEAAPETGGLISVDANLGAGWFDNMTLSKNALSLRCQLSKEITFSVKPLNADITQVDFYYRIVDRATGSAFDWQNAGRMPRDVSGNFVLVFSGDDVNANFRKPSAWLDFQFIGLSKSGGVVGRSEKIEQQVSYTLDCP